MSSRSTKFFLIAMIVVLIVAFFAFDLQRFLTLEYLKDRQQAFAEFLRGQPPADHRHLLCSLRAWSQHSPCLVLRS